MEEVSGYTHICSVCGRAGVWGPTWSWYGSELEGPKAKFCSSACQSAFSANKKRLPVPDRVLRSIEGGIGAYPSPPSDPIAHPPGP